MESIEEMLDSVGLMQEPGAALKRTAVGLVIGYLVINQLKPSFAYDPKTLKPYPWKLTQKKDDPATGTMMPYWAAMAIPAIVLGVLI